MRRIPDLKDKIKFVEGVSDFRALRAKFEIDRKSQAKTGDWQGYLRGALQEQSYATRLGIHAAQWTRVKKGDDPIKDYQLSILATHLDLDQLGGVDLWTLPLEEFKDVLRRKGYGKLGTAGGMSDLAARLRALAGPVPTIRISAVDDRISRGIGDPDDPKTMPLLAVGQRVRIEISGCPHDGSAVVLSEDPSQRLVVLGGTGVGLWKVTRGNPLMLPSVDGAFPVGKPLGRHSLYVALFAARPRLPAVLTNDAKATTGVLSPSATTALSGALADAGDSARVGLLDYRVE
jgi:hypothetical protein